MGRMTPVEVPSDFRGSTAGAVREQWRQHRREGRAARQEKARERWAAVERFCDDRFAGDEGLWLFAFTACQLGRTPAGLSAGELEAWLRAGYAASREDEVAA